LSSRLPLLPLSIEPVTNVKHSTANLKTHLLDKNAINSSAPSTAASISISTDDLNNATSLFIDSMDYDVNVPRLHLSSPSYLNRLRESVSTAEEILLSQGCDLTTLQGKCAIDEN
jgi:hypothetical protein